LFSFGAVLYEMATGRQAFSGNTTAVVHDAILNRAPVAAGRLNPELPARLEALINKALEKNRDMRCQTASEMKTDLKRLKRDTDSSRTSVSGEVAAVPRSQASWREKVPLAMGIVAILALLFTAWVFWFSAASDAIESVAVLPFDNSGGDPETQYLSDGITDSLIFSLSQLPKLKVMSHTTAFRYKARKDSEAVGRELGVRAVVTGTVVHRGDGLSISVYLVDAKDNTSIWGQPYNGKLADIVTLQEQIARDVSEKLRLRLGDDDTKRLTRGHTENADANLLYSKGKYFWNQRTREALTKSLEYFHQAIDKDPDYALAYAGLADSYVMLGTRDYGGGMAPKEAMPLAKEAALSALKKDPTLAEARVPLGSVAHYYDWNWVEAEKEFKKAIELNQSYAEAHRQYATYLRNMGRFAEAGREYNQAVALEPHSPSINAIAGIFLWFNRQPDQAVESLLKTVKEFPDFWLAPWYLGIVYEHKLMYKDAFSQYQKASELDRSNPVPRAALARISAKSGDTLTARELLDDLEKKSGDAYVSNFDLARIYAALGDKNLALNLLEKTYEERDGSIVQIKVNPSLDSLRSEPRFIELEKKMNFPK
jgi:TolB-like protein/Tfp pilus assembly protein PilF